MRKYTEVAQGGKNSNEPDDCQDDFESLKKLANINGSVNKKCRECQIRYYTSADDCDDLQHHEKVHTAANQSTHNDRLSPLFCIREVMNKKR